MNKVILFTLLFIALCHGIQWKVWQTANVKLARVVTVEQSPPTTPYTFEVRAVEAAFAPGRRSIDAIDFLLSVAVIPHWTVRHYQASTDTVEARAARHALRKIIEFVDVGAPGFNPDVDTIVSTYQLWNATWSTIQITKQQINGTNVWSLSSHTVDGLVTITVYLTENAVTVTANGLSISLDNNAIHHTLSINNYPYRQNNTKLALKVHFESRTTIQDFASTAQENDTELVGIAGDLIRPVAVWQNTVQVTGANCPTTVPIARDIYRDVESVKDVDVTLPKLPVETTIALNVHITYFSFLTTPPCQPTSIFWDPDLGIQDNSLANFASSSVPSLILLAILLIYSLL